MRSRPQTDATFLKQRYAALSNHPGQIGIDYITVERVETAVEGQSSRQFLLTLHFVPPTEEASTSKKDVLAAITRDNIRITDALGADTTSLQLVRSEANQENNPLPIVDGYGLQIRVEEDTSAVTSAVDSLTYTLQLVDVPNLDPFFAQVTFSLQVDEPAEFDCQASLQSGETLAAPEIDYRAKDYSTFRKLMVDRLSVLMPGWEERNPADVGVVLVETLAHAADYLSYYQDAVATEAYLGTARRRISVRRHARLLDYFMHEGCNARTWVQVQVENGSNSVLLPKGTALLTRVVAQAPRIPPNSAIYEQVLAEKPEIFETMHPAELFPAHNEISFYTWGANEFILPQGATKATLRDDWFVESLFNFSDELDSANSVLEKLRSKLSEEYSISLSNEATIATTTIGWRIVDSEWTYYIVKRENGDAEKHERQLKRLQRGDVLIFEETKSPQTGKIADADPAYRHPVRLTKITLLEDPLGGALLGDSGGGAVPIVEVEWHTQDALPFDLCVSTIIGGERVENVSVACGNMVLVDHGQTIADEELLATMVPENGRYRPRLQRSNITHSVPYNDAFERTQRRSVASVLTQDAYEASPTVRLIDENGANWTGRRDLLNSDRFAQAFIVEIESDGSSHLRFGDGMRGKQPAVAANFIATYRIGNGLSGNVGREAIAHAVTSETDIIKVSNPLPAQGGLNPEPIEQVQRDAPQALRNQERAVTQQDYAAVAQRHPEVQRAAASLQLTGSWHTVYLTVNRVGNRPIDEPFKADLIAFLEQFRLIGYDLEIRPPRFVPLDIVLTVHVAPEYFRSTVRQACLETFSNVELPDGRRGFFHPDSFTFGQPIYLSPLVATAMGVPGVAWTETDRFQRWGRSARDELQSGEIPIGPLEIARLDNNPDAPEYGTIRFNLKGGR